MLTRITAIFAVIACLLTLLVGCKPQGDDPPANTTAVQGNVSTTTQNGASINGTATTTDTQDTTTDNSSNTTDHSTSVTSSNGTTVDGATTTNNGSTTNNTTTGTNTTKNGADPTTSNLQGGGSTTTSVTIGNDGTTSMTNTTIGTTTTPDTDAPVVPAGLLPGTAAAGSSFATLARAPKDNAVTVEADTKQFGRFLFTTSDNNDLPFNVACHIEDDRITALLPANADLAALKPNFTYYGDSVLYNGAVLISRSTVMDLTKDATLTLKAGNGSTRTVTVHVETIGSGLPSFSLSTSGYAAIDNTVDYKAATFSVGDAKTTVKGADCSVKGRGNTTWTYDKKGYTLRFDTKYSLLGLRESKNYVLLALHADRTLMRYRLGEYLSEAMGLEFTMGSAYVDLWLNGEYQGVYALVEKIEVEPARVNITDYVSPTVPVNEMGYLLEFDKHLYNTTTEADRKNWTVLGSGFYDAATNEVFFYSEALGGHWLTVRTTNAKNLTANHVTYIALVVETAAKALKSGDWATVSKWIDVESFVNWYLIMEYLNNTDTDMESSVYMYIDVGGKLKLGPLWDLDNCAGNHNETASATAHPLYDSKDGWFSYLFEMPEAKAILRTRWAAMKTATNDIGKVIDDTAAELRDAAALNFTRWDILGTALSGQPAAIAQADTYEKQVTYLKNYLAERKTALDAFYSAL